MICAFLLEVFQVGDVAFANLFGCDWVGIRLSMGGEDDAFLFG
jgi:hypothetical protein